MKSIAAKGNANAIGEDTNIGDGIDSNFMTNKTNNNHNCQQLNVIDIQSPIGEDPKSHVAFNIERVQAAKTNLMKMRNFRNRQKFSPTKVGVLFKPNEFMDTNLVKSDRDKNRKKLKKKINRNSKKSRSSSLVKQQTHTNEKRRTNQEKERNEQERHDVLQKLYPHGRSQHRRPRQYTLGCLRIRDRKHKRFGHQ